MGSFPSEQVKSSLFYLFFYLMFGYAGSPWMHVGLPPLAISGLLIAAASVWDTASVGVSLGLRCDPRA